MTKIEYRIKQKGNKFFPQYKHGIRTLWLFEYVTECISFDTYKRLSFNTIEEAQKFINDVLKVDHYRDYFRKIHKVD